MVLLMSSIPVEAKKKKYEGDFEFVDEVSYPRHFSKATEREEQTIQ